MRVLVSSVGTRGDVQPAMALAIELRALGQEVRLCLPPNFTGWAQALGFPATPVGVEMRAPRPGAPAAPPAPVPDLITDQFESVAAAARGCGLIVGAGAHQYAARSIAELEGAGYVEAVYAPVSLPSPARAAPGWEETKRRWNDRALERVNANRTRLGLRPIDDVLGHILTERPWLPADPTLGPAPSTPGLTIVQTGAWLPSGGQALPPALDAFLGAGEPPVYLGLGSMPAAEGVARTLIEAARAVGRRAVLSSGWAGLGPIDDGADCITIDDVDHSALFPRVAAVVHHGGAGTTTTAALAGAPQVVTPMFADQFYWAGRVEALGLGASLPAAGMTAEALAQGLGAALRPAVAEKARSIAGRIVPDGAAVAARRLVEEHG